MVSRIKKLGVKSCIVNKIKLFTMQDLTSILREGKARIETVR